MAGSGFDLSPLLPRARAVELSAEANRQWARQLIAQAETLAEPKASATLKEVKVNAPIEDSRFGKPQ